MIEANNLTKRFGANTAVDDVSFRVEPGMVTGFLGPNGAGKSTTMRMIVGLDRPSSGSVTVNGSPYTHKRAPLHEVGALLEAKSAHPRRSARNHLRTIAATHGIPNRRVDEVLELTGLGSVANKKVGKFSLGMGQRLGIASALIGDPKVLILDEPVNGLDPEGVTWVRSIARYWAGQGKTVMISSHLIAEMSQTADRVLVLGRGKVIADGSVEELLSGSGAEVVRVKADAPAEVQRILAGSGATVEVLDGTTVQVTGATSRQIAEAALREGVLIYELTPTKPSLEDAFFALTKDSVEYHATLGQATETGEVAS